MKIINQISCIGLLLLTSGFSLAAEPAGTVVDVLERAWVTPAGGEQSALRLQQSIHEGDKIETNDGGAVKILFSDNTLLTVKENSSVLITQFLFDEGAGKRHAVFEAAAGTIRTVVDRFFGKDQPVEIKTPTAVAGIRGTDLAAEVNSEASTFYCFECLPDVVEIYNIEFPDQMVSLNTGKSIKILRRKPAEENNIIPIPEDIRKDRESIFDISMLLPSGASQLVGTATYQLVGPGEGMRGAMTPGGEDGGVFGISQARLRKEGLVLYRNQGSSDYDIKMLPGGLGCPH